MTKQYLTKTTNCIGQKLHDGHFPNGECKITTIKTAWIVHIAHYPCYWKIPQHHAKQRKTTQNVVKMKKDKNIIKLPDSFKRYNYFRSSEVKIYPAKNLLMRSRNGLLATVLIVKLDLSNCVKKQTILNARFELQITCENLKSYRRKFFR